MGEVIAVLTTSCVYVFRWLQFTPITFITKLNIELSMSDLLMRLATQKCSIAAERDQRVLADRELTESAAAAKPAADNSASSNAIEMGPLDPDDNWQWSVLRTREVVTDVERAVVGPECASTTASGSVDDEQPLRQEWERVGHHESTSCKTEIKTAPVNTTGEEQ